MKKKYDAPVVLIETYELNQSIANNCSTTVDNGPGNEIYPKCDKYVPIGDMGGLSLKEPEFATQRQEMHPQFYEGGSINACDCYTTGAGAYWTS